MKTLILITLFFVSSCGKDDCIDYKCPNNHKACPPSCEALN